MRYYVLPFFIVLALSALGFTHLDSTARAEGAAEMRAELDAGVAPDPVVAADHAAPAAPPAPIVKDPTDDPSGYAKDVQGAFRAGQWALLVVLGLFGVARLLLFAAAKWSITWLKRATPALVASSAALAACGASLSAGGSIDWRAMLGALAMVVALYLSPAPKAKEV